MGKVLKYKKKRQRMECGDKVNAKVNAIIEDIKGLKDPENWTW